MNTRQYKFRGYFKGKMYYPDTSQEYENAIFHCFSEQAKTDKERSECSIMQWTELTVNGIDLYEGDIIKKPNGVWGVIVYKAPSFEVTVSHDQSSLYTREWIEDSEIIGNIYEHPELLK